jgi:hypothetical protein
MKNTIKNTLLCAFSVLTMVSLWGCKDDGVEISDKYASKVPKNVKLLEYSESSLTVCWDFIRGATSYTVQLVDGNMVGIKEDLIKTVTDIDYYEFTTIVANEVYYARVRANYPYSATSEWVYVSRNDKPAMLMAGMGIVDVNPEIELYDATGSTLTFEWAYTEDTAADAAFRYNVELFNDEACTDLFVSWIADGALSTSGTGLFTVQSGNPILRFTFSGLEPETTYYGRVSNTSIGNIKTPVLAAATKAAGPAVAVNNPAQTGDVVLSQDFSNFIHGGDVVRGAAGYNAKAATEFRTNWEVAKGENPISETDRPVAAWNTEFGVWAGDVSNDYRQALGMNGWSRNSTGDNVSTRPGYVKIGGSKGIASLYTPTLATLPDNATVTVRFSAGAYAEGATLYSRDIVVKAVEGATVSSANVAENGVVITSSTVDISEAVGKFKTYSVTLEELSKTSRIAFCSNPDLVNDNLTRFLLDDVVITYEGIGTLQKLPVPANVAFDSNEIYSDKLTLKWDAVEGAVSYTVAYWKDGTPETGATEVTGLTATSYLLKDLDADTKYHAKVKACRYNNPAFDSEYSAAATATTNNVVQAAGIVVTKVKSTSSTLTVEWARVDGEPCVNSSSQTYYAAIYTDAARQSLVVGWDLSNIFSITAGTKFRYTFSGLEPAKTYYICVDDKTNDMFSDPLAYATAAAKPAVTANNPALTGDIILSEDFAGLIHCGDIANFAPAYSAPNTDSYRATYRKASGDNPAVFINQACTAGEFDLFAGGGVGVAYTEGTGLAAWGKGGNIATRAGYTKFGTGSAAASLYTPELAKLPAGASNVKISFAAQAYSEKFDGSGADAGTILIKVVSGAVLGAKGAISGTITEVDAAAAIDISSSKAQFKTFETTLSGVTPDCRIVISTSEKRALIDDIVITYTGPSTLTQLAVPANVLFDAGAIYSDKLTLKWDAVDGAASYTVAYWQDGTQESAATEVTGLTSASCTLPGLSASTKYHAKVKAVHSNPAYDSAYSASVAETTGNAPQPAGITVTKVKSTSSTLTVEWARVDGEPCVNSAAQTYYAAIYSDAACQSLVVGWNVSNLFTVSSVTNFRYTFSGLQPATTYYICVDDVTNDLFSDPLPYATAAAGPVATANATAGTGDIVLAQDFSKFIHGGDVVHVAPGYNAKASSSFRQQWETAAGVNPVSDGNRLVVAWNTEFNLWAADVSNDYRTALGMADWARGASSQNVSTRPGYVKIGGGSALAALYTPELAKLPANSTVTVSFSAAVYSEGSKVYGRDVVVQAVDGVETSSGSVTQAGTVKDTKTVDISGALGEFKTFSVTLNGLTPTSRIVFGSNPDLVGSNQTRFLLDDVVITCTGVNP